MATLGPKHPSKSAELLADVHLSRHFQMLNRAQFDDLLDELDKLQVSADKTMVEFRVLLMANQGVSNFTEMIERAMQKLERGESTEGLHGEAVRAANLDKYWKQMSARTEQLEVQLSAVANAVLGSRRVGHAFDRSLMTDVSSALGAQENQRQHGGPAF